MTTVSATEFLKGGAATTLVKPVSSTSVSTSSPTTNTETPSFGSRVSNDINDAGLKVRQQITGEGEFAGQSSIQRGVGATATASSVPLKVAYEALPEFARKGLSYLGEKIKGGFNAVVDKISDNKALQNFMVDVPKGNAGEEILGTLGGGGEIAGNILAYEGMAKTLDKAFSDPYKKIRGEFQGPKNPPPEGGSGIVDINAKKVPDMGGGNYNTMKLYDHMIETKQVPAETVYADVANKIYQPEIATKIVDDATNYLRENGFPKLADQLTHSVDITHLTPELMTQTAEHILSNPSLIAVLARGTGSVAEKVKGVLPKSKLLGTVTEADTSVAREVAAIKDATPNYETATPTIRKKLLGRLDEGAVAGKGRSVRSNDLEIEAGKEVANIPEYDPKATKLEKYQVVKNEVTKRAEQLKADVANEPVIISKKEVASRVQKKINEVQNRSLLIQSSDPAIANYTRVLKNGLSQVEGKPSGILELRKNLDDIYENARGKQAFGSDKIAALDEVHTAARNELTQILIDSVKNTDVKASLRSQWNLYRALDQLTIEAEKEAGTSIGRFGQKHPIIKKTVEAVGRATGLGAGVNIVK